MDDAITYVSFAEKDQCFGVLLIKGAFSAADAAKAAHFMGLNPGGEAMSIIIRSSDEDIPPGMFEVYSANTGRLIPPKEAMRLFDARSIRELRNSEKL